MATFAQTPQVGQQQDGPTGRSMADAVSGVETTPDNPLKGSTDERLADQQITDEMKADLMEIMRKYTEMWSLPRRITVRNTLRRLEYVKGNQYISFDPYSFNFYDPMEGDASGNNLLGDNEMGGQDVYQYVSNVVQWLLRVFVATLGSTLPVTRFSPCDATSDLDNRTAEQASRANALIERWNNAKRMLKQRLAYLGIAGVYFRHTRYVRDSRICGSQSEPQYGMEEMQVWPDHYQCPQCAESTPADAFAAMKGAPHCKSCGVPLSSADFHPAYSMQMPVVKGYADVPKGQVRQTVYNNLHVSVAPWDSESGEDPLDNTPMLNLGVEIDQAALRAMYPDDWNVVDGGGESAGAPEGELDRMARLRSYIPGLTRGSGLMTSGQLPTYNRTWLQPVAFNTLQEKPRADRLKARFPKGVCVASVNGKWLSCREASLTDEWTMATTGITSGANPPAVLDPAMDFQDRINDISNSVHEYFDRLSSPGILYNSKLISKGFNGQFVPPGRLIPIPLGKDPNRKLADALFQPQFHIDGGWNQYLQGLMLMSQLLTGVTPQMYGGHQQGIDTKGGQEQALQVASGIMRLYWDQVREEDCRAAKIAVRCLAENATEDVYNVIEGEGGPGSHKNDPIDIANLKGEFNAYPDEEQGYPVSFEETREVLQQIIEASSKNPLIQELFQPMSNRRYFARYLAPGLEIPGEHPRYKVLKDIGKLMTGAPIMGLDPTTGTPTQLPSIIPDYDFDDLEISQELVQDFAEKNHDLEQERPKQFLNLRLYFRLCARFVKQKAMEQASPTMPGAPGAAGPGGPPAGPPGAGGPPIPPPTGTPAAPPMVQ